MKAIQKDDLDFLLIRNILMTQFLEAAKVS